ncbi:WD40 repeat domain-containing protein [Thermodesulfobium sp. 4217-1]|uniref:WD40 repeat domain-containing protein n=1 Tax=Thermodesulfobium sp. 4217-1 TaxID=3120013 RepID=UPI003221CBFB
MKNEFLEPIDSKMFNISSNSLILDKIIIRSIEEIDFMEIDLKSDKKSPDIKKIDFDILHKIYWNTSFPTVSSISKNAKYFILGFFDGTINFWSMLDGLFLGKIFLSKNPIIAISSSDNEEFLVVGTWDGCIFIYSILQGKIIYHKKIENKPIRKIFYFDGLDLISYLTDDSKIYFLSLKNNKKLLLYENNLKITSYDIKLNENLIFLGFENGLIEIFNFNTNISENKIFMSNNKIVNLSASVDVKYVLSTDESHSNSLNIYKLDSLQSIYTANTYGTCLDAKFVNYSDIAMSVINSSSNLKILTKKDSPLSKSIIIKYNKSSSDLANKKIFNFNEQISTALISEDIKKVYFGTKSGILKKCSLNSQEVNFSEILEPEVPINKIFVHTDSEKLLCFNKNYNVYVYNGLDLKNFSIINVKNAETALSAADSAAYWTEKENKLYLLDLTKKEISINSFEIEFSPFKVLLFKNRFYLSTKDGQIFIYDAELKSLFDCFNTGIDDGKFSVCSRLNIIGYYNDKVLKMYDRLGKLLAEIKFDLKKIDLLTFSDDGMYFAFSCDDEIYLYDVVSSEIIKQFVGHYDKIADIKFKSNSNILLSVGFDKIVNFWKF